MNDYTTNRSHGKFTNQKVLAIAVQITHNGLYLAFLGDMEKQKISPHFFFN